MKSVIFFSFLTFGFCEALALPSRYIAVANRSDSSISLINSESSRVVKNLNSENLGFVFEPMYVSNIKSQGVFVVGDRKNSKLLIFDNSTGELIKQAETSKGVFHQWALSQTGQVVVVADQDKAVDLFQIQKNSYGQITVSKKTLNLLSIGYESAKPHDVILDQKHMFVSMHDKNENNENIDRVLKINLKSFLVEGELEFTEDVHLGLPQESGLLLVLEQQTGVLNLIDRKSFKVTGRVPNLPGAHGVFWKKDASQIFVANIASSGLNSVYKLGASQSGFTSVAKGDTKFSKPHNLSADFKMGLLFLTHSGGSNDKVSVLDLNDGLKLVTEVSTGKNPFGLGFIEQ